MAEQSVVQSPRLTIKVGKYAEADKAVAAIKSLLVLVKGNDGMTIIVTTRSGARYGIKMISGNLVYSRKDGSLPVGKSEVTWYPFNEEMLKPLTDGGIEIGSNKSTEVTEVKLKIVRTSYHPVFTAKH